MSMILSVSTLTVIKGGGGNEGSLKYKVNNTKICNDTLHGI